MTYPQVYKFLLELNKVSRIFRVCVYPTPIFLSWMLLCKVHNKIWNINHNRIKFLKCFRIIDIFTRFASPIKILLFLKILL